MVLAGVEGQWEHDRIFYVVDPGRNEKNAMRFIKQWELRHKTGGFWWVYQKGEPETRTSVAENQSRAIPAGRVGTRTASQARRLMCGRDRKYPLERFIRTRQ